jgi:hypothetical protein
MDKEFMATGLIFLMPITLCCVLFSLFSIQAYGYPMASYDVVGTHYAADIDGYAPLVPAINTAAEIVLGASLYPYWFILFTLTVSFYIPYLLLFEITRKHRYGIYYIYATAIALINFLVGLLPQAVIVCLILLLIARPKWFLAILTVSFFVHGFGVFFILLAKLWLMFDDSKII